MPLNLCKYKTRTSEAIKFFWRSRDKAAQKQAKSGKADAGARGAVTAGKNMDNFLPLITDIVKKNGLPNATVHIKKGVTVLPGYFRPTKTWDVVVMDGSTLIAVLELKSHVGPSFGNNFNNRCEEALGSGIDIITAYREGAFGKNAPKPFLGWLIHVEDCPKSNKSVAVKEPHFPVMKVFKKTRKSPPPSYVERYEIFCRKMMKEQLYDSAALILSEKSAKSTGIYRDVSTLTGIQAFLSGLAGHVAKIAAVKQR